MRRAKIAAGLVAALTVAAAGGVRAEHDRWAGHFVRTTTLVPRMAPQSQPPAAPPSRAAPPHSSMAPPQSRPMPRAPFGPGGFPHHHGASPQYRPYYVPPPIVIPRYVPPPAFYGYAPAPYVAPPPAYYDYSPPAYVAPPPAYVERDDGYWYYCAPLGAYYPDVSECPEQWIPVPRR